LLRTADALTPFLTARTALTSLAVFCSIYSFIFAFGVVYLHRLLRAGPLGSLVLPAAGAIPQRPMSVVDEPFEPAVQPVASAAYHSTARR
jgi:cytochrome d ubiquinol oxidase subunit I